MPRKLATFNARVHLPRLADVVAERIRDAILVGELEDGERLPPVDTLLEQFGVSAPSMREALRVLEAEGLVKVQRGGIGGAVVHRPTAKTAAYTLALVLRSQSTAKRDVSRAVTLLEPLCVRQCAERRDRKSVVLPELRKLNTAARALVDGDELLFNDTMIAFHRALVRLAGNDTLALVTSALEHIWSADVRAWVSASSSRGRYPTVATRRREVDRHEQITRLIAAGDGPGAADAMSEHIERSAHETLVDPSGVVDPMTVRFGPGNE